MTNATPLPRRLTNVGALLSTDTEAAGVLWKLDGSDRGLDSNVVALSPGQHIERHAGAEVDVLLLVLSGNGSVDTADETIALASGDLVWLPRYSERSFEAGESGLIYLTVHQHRESLVVKPFRGDQDTNGQVV
ncbi:cupin domain-containing protein [Gordonia sp. CPCC 205333]|uniref:cupin domain-containing protein n=1 Tax=Gordonia sp. CPCC 205333 TaxID=3140790 RepID=UPI003AF386A5